MCALKEMALVRVPSSDMTVKVMAVIQVHKKKSSRKSEREGQCGRIVE